VTDIAGNALAQDVTWSFNVNDFTTPSADVQLSGLQLSIPYSSNLGTALALNVTTAFSKLLSISATRFKNVQFSAAPNGQTLVSMTITSSTNGRRSAEPETASSRISSLILEHLENRKHSMFASDSNLGQMSAPGVTVRKFEVVNLLF